MNYRALIQNRKSVREFTDRKVPFSALDAINDYYRHRIRRLVPELNTELYIFGTDSRAALEGSAGYNQFLVGAPQYLVLMSEPHAHAGLNAGYMMEDMVLKLTEMGLDSCWVTFADSEDVKQALGIESELDVAAIIAFGFGQKTFRRLRLNIRSMSQVDLVAKHRYMEPKRSVQDLAYVDQWGNSRNLDDAIGFFDDLLWEALYAASLSPSYLNRQAYGFLLRDNEVILVSRPDGYNTKTDGDLSLGIVLLHFTAVAENWSGTIRWKLGADVPQISLPDGHSVIAAAVV